MTLIAQQLQVVFMKRNRVLIGYPADRRMTHFTGIGRPLMIWDFGLGSGCSMADYTASRRDDAFISFHMTDCTIDL